MERLPHACLGWVVEGRCPQGCKQHRVCIAFVALVQEFSPSNVETSGSWRISCATDCANCDLARLSLRNVVATNMRDALLCRVSKILHILNAFGSRSPSTSENVTVGAPPSLPEDDDWRDSSPIRPS